MEVQAMHITVEQGIQAIAGNVRRMLFSEEIDWILNDQVDQYIGTHASSLREKPGAADSLVHLNRLSSLLTSAPIPAYQETPLRVRSAIPYSVAELLSVEANVKNLCGETYGPTDRKRNTLILLPIKKSIASSEWYKTVRVFVNLAEVFNMQHYATARGVTFNGFQGPDEDWRMLNVLLPELADRYEVHWEIYGDLYFPSTIIISGLSESSASIEIDGTSTNATVQYLTQTQYIVPEENPMPARLYFQTNLHQMRVGAFSRTSYRSPLAYLQENMVVTEMSTSFIVGGIRINYVKKPRRIDLSLNQHCELPDSAHSDICNLTIEHIKLMREDPNWEAKLKQNMLRTTI